MSIMDSNNIINSSVRFAESGNGPLGSDLAGSIFEDWLYPGAQQEREFAQQVALQDAQNQWNSEQEKLRRMKEAGINLATAAGAAAGSGNAPATSSPNSAVGAGASLPSAVGSLAENVGAGVNAYEKLSLTPVEREKRSAETVAALEAAGFSHWEAKAIEVMLPDRQKNLQADTFLKIANYRNTCEEYQNILIEHDQRKADIDLKEKQAYQAEKSGNLAEATRLKVEAETDLLEYNKWWQETEKSFWLEHGYKSDDPLDVSLRNAAANNKQGAAEAVGDAIEHYNYRTELGIKTADVEKAYEEAFDEAKGNADVAAMFAQYNADVESWKQIFVQLWTQALENPKDIKGGAMKFINMINNIIYTAGAAVAFPIADKAGTNSAPKSGSRYGK